MKTIFIFFELLLIPFFAYCQTFGPNNPGIGATETTVGTNPWTSAGRIYTSNDNDAYISTLGTSHYLEASKMGFTIPSTSIITGIQVDIEKSSTAMQNVEILDNWLVGTNRPLSSGINRCMLVIISLENATARDINSVSYGGVSMLPLIEEELMTTFFAKKEVWYLLETDLASVVGTNITYNFAPSVPVENFEIVTSGIYQYVDQTNTFFDLVSSVRSGGHSNYQIGSLINTMEGGMSITSVFCGNPPNPMQALGASNGFTINSGFTELIDRHTAHPSFTNSGGVSQVSQKLALVSGSEQPIFNFNGAPNRLVAIGIFLRRARQLDNSVRLRKAIGYEGNDYAQIGVDWPLSDAISTYGGPGDLWGTTWTYEEINDVAFGVGLSVELQNGTATVDHITITVYTATTLPVSLLDFTLNSNNQQIHLNWSTNSERDNDYFKIEKSVDGVNWILVQKIDGRGTTNQNSNYEAIDENPFPGRSYYKLSQVDFNGLENELALKTVNMENQINNFYPNPVKSHLQFSEQINPNSQIDFYNNLGEKMEIQKYELNGKYFFNFNDISNGSYFVRITNGNTQINEKLLVLH